MLAILSFFIFLQLEHPKSQLKGMVDIMVMPGKKMINGLWPNSKADAAHPLGDSCCGNDHRLRREYRA